MTPMEQRYLEYIQRQLTILSERTHTDPKLQIIFQLGFIQAQLAQAMARDSDVHYYFARAIERNGLTKPVPSQSLKKPYT